MSSTFDNNKLKALATELAKNQGVCVRGNQGVCVRARTIIPARREIKGSDSLIFIPSSANLALSLQVKGSTYGPITPLCHPRAAATRNSAWQ